MAVVDAMPDAILTGPDNYARNYQQLTRTVPIIAMTEDMVGAGLVASLARPGGNTTGISLLSPWESSLAMRTLIHMVPSARRMAARSMISRSLQENTWRDCKVRRARARYRTFHFWCC